MELPPDRVIEAVLQRYARLVERVGAEIGERPLVLPTNEFFPDRFERNRRGAMLLASRMQNHAGLDDVPLEVTVVGSEAPQSGGASCASGACAAPALPNGDGPPRLAEHGDGWRLNVPEPELGHPVVLTTMMARALGHVFLAETLEEGQQLDPPVEYTADLAAVALGLGPLLMQGSYMYSKSCGGPSVAKATLMSLPELAVAVAVFAELGGHSIRKAAKELDTTQEALLAEARGWAKSNERVIALVGSDPARIARGDFELNDAQPLLVRLLKRKKTASVDDLPDDFSVDDLEALAHTMPDSRRKKTRPRDEKRDELKALVDEAFGETPADAE